MYDTLNRRQVRRGRNVLIAQALVALDQHLDALHRHHFGRLGRLFGQFSERASVMRIIFFALAFVMPVMTTAAELSANCPLTLEAEAVSVRAPAGYIGSLPREVRLSAGGVMRGPPNSMGYLIPSSTKKSKAVTTQTYVFDEGNEKWLWCTYGDSPLQLAKRLSDAATVCTVAFEENKHGNIVRLDVTCRGAPH